jgi:hypothetical protein
MKLFLNIFAACLTLFGQIIPFEGTDWGINYLNAHPHLIKPLPLAIGLVSSFFFTLTITPLSNAKKPVIVGYENGRAVYNPFWIWIILCLIITFGMNMLME